MTAPAETSPHSFVLGSSWDFSHVILALLIRQEASISVPVSPIVSVPGPRGVLDKRHDAFLSVETAASAATRAVAVSFNAGRPVGSSEHHETFERPLVVGEAGRGAEGARAATTRA